MPQEITQQVINVKSILQNCQKKITIAWPLAIITNVTALKKFQNFMAASSK